MHSKPKYLLLAPWPVKPNTGVNTVILGLAEAMSVRYDPVLVVTGWDRPPSNQQWLKMPAFSLPFWNAAGFFVKFIPNMLRLRRLARGAVALNPHYVGLELLPLLALRRLRLCPKVILSVHGADADRAALSTGLEAVLYRWMFQTADVVVACSNALAGSVRAVWPEANIVSIWNAIRWPEPVNEQRPMEQPYLICVANFVKKKAHDILLPAFQEVLRQHPGLHLVLIGGYGVELPVLIALGQSLNITASITIIQDIENEDVLWWIRHALTRRTVWHFTAGGRSTWHASGGNPCWRHPGICTRWSMRLTVRSWQPRPAYADNFENTRQSRRGTEKSSGFPAAGEGSQMGAFVCRV
jgi:glycosyltransferase involved in cell wall biosynthesis